MKKVILPKTRINNLSAYLRSTDADEIIIQTSFVAGGWHDNEFDANRAGFTITRFINEELEAKHLFPECYHIVRK